MVAEFESRMENHEDDVKFRHTATAPIEENIDRASLNEVKYK